MPSPAVSSGTSRRRWRMAREEHKAVVHVDIAVRTAGGARSGWPWCRFIGGLAAGERNKHRCGCHYGRARVALPRAHIPGTIPIREGSPSAYSSVHELSLEGELASSLGDRAPSRGHGATDCHQAPPFTPYPPTLPKTQSPPLSSRSTFLAQRHRCQPRPSPPLHARPPPRTLRRTAPGGRNGAHRNRAGDEPLPSYTR